MSTQTRRPWADKWLLVQVFVLLGVTRLAINVLSFRRLARAFGPHQVETPADAPAEQLVAARRIAWAIHRVSPYTPWKSNCFPQALTAKLAGVRRDLEILARPARVAGPAAVQQQDAEPGEVGDEAEHAIDDRGADAAGGPQADGRAGPGDDALARSPARHVERDGHRQQGEQGQHHDGARGGGQPGGVRGHGEGEDIARHRPERGQDDAGEGARREQRPEVSGQRPARRGHRDARGIGPGRRRCTRQRGSAGHSQFRPGRS